MCFAISNLFVTFADKTKYMRIKRSDIINILRKICKFGLYIPLSNLFITYGGRKLSDETLSRIARKRNQRIQRKLFPIVQSVLKDSTPIPIPNIQVADAIWVCWFQGEEQMPPIPKLCLKYIRHNCGGHPVIVLSSKNYHNYVFIPQHVRALHQEGKISNAVYSDILRLNLLSQQGGFWMDATILPVSPIDDSIFKSDVWSIKIPETGYFVSKCRWCGFALATKIHSQLATAAARCFHQYFEKTTVQMDYFLIDQFIDLLYQYQPEIKGSIDAIPVSNKQLYGLEPIMCNQFNENQYKSLVNDTKMFKLSWKSYTNEQLLTNPNSFFNIISNML